MHDFPALIDEWERRIAAWKAVAKRLRGTKCNDGKVRLLLKQQAVEECIHDLRSVLTAIESAGSAVAVDEQPHVAGDPASDPAAGAVVQGLPFDGTAYTGD